MFLGSWFSKVSLLLGRLNSLPSGTGFLLPDPCISFFFGDLHAVEGSGSW